MRWSVVMVASWMMACGGWGVQREPVAAPAPEGASPLPPLEPDVASPEGRDECGIDIAALEPMLAASQPGAEGPVKVERGHNRVVEHVRFTDGRELRVVQLGCNHLGINWMMAPVPTEGDVVAVARAQFGPIVEAGSESSMVHDILEEAAPDEQGNTPCGDATCTLTRRGAVLEFDYLFAL